MRIKTQIIRAHGTQQKQCAGLYEEINEKQINSLTSKLEKQANKKEHQQNIKVS